MPQNVRVCNSRKSFQASLTQYTLMYTPLYIYVSRTIALPIREERHAFTECAVLADSDHVSWEAFCKLPMFDAKRGHMMSCIDDQAA